MVAVGMVQVAVHQVVHVIAVGNLLVAAVRAVAMLLLMPAAGVVGRAGSGVRGSDLQNVVINVVAMNVVQVAVVQVIRMAIVPDGDMAATRTVLVGMSLMHSAVLIVHLLTPLFGDLVCVVRTRWPFYPHGIS
jgi:hypothetical protein